MSDILTAEALDEIEARAQNISENFFRLGSEALWAETDRIALLASHKAQAAEIERLTARAAAAEDKVAELVDTIRKARHAVLDLYAPAIIALHVSGTRQDEIKAQVYAEQLNYFDAILANFDAALGAKTALLPVECGACGWTGKRKPGNPVTCPKCGAWAAFQPIVKKPGKS